MKLKYLTFLILLAVSHSLPAITKADLKPGQSCRSPKVKHQFDILNHHPYGWKGHIVDHTCALANGGLDIVENMQYQTIAESAAKDRWENTPAGRKAFCTPENSLPYRTVFNCK